MALRTYLDASVLVGLLTDDASSQRADAVIRSSGMRLTVSDFGTAEFASAVSRKVRMGELTRRDAGEAFSDLDLWLAGSVERVELRSSDLAAATAILRGLGSSLRTPDAIHVAIAMRLGLPLATFDRRLAADAARLGLSTVGL